MGGPTVYGLSVHRPHRSSMPILLNSIGQIRKLIGNPLKYMDLYIEPIKIYGKWLGKVGKWLGLSPRSASGRRPCKYYPVPCFYWSRALFGSAREARIFGTGLRDGTEIGLN